MGDKGASEATKEVNHIVSQKGMGMDTERCKECKKEAVAISAFQRTNNGVCRKVRSDVTANVG